MPGPTKDKSPYLQELGKVARSDSMQAVRGEIGAHGRQSDFRSIGTGVFAGLVKRHKSPREMLPPTQKEELGKVARSDSMQTVRGEVGAHGRQSDFRSIGTGVFAGLVKRQKSPRKMLPPTQKEELGESGPERFHAGCSWGGWCTRTSIRLS